MFLLDQAGSFFVVRAKDNLTFDAVDAMLVDTEKTDVLDDQKILLRGVKSQTLYPKFLRRITYYDREKKLALIFLTNNFYGH